MKITWFFVVFVCTVMLVQKHDAANTCYGNVRNLRPSGKIPGGVPASNREVGYDIRDLNKMKKCYDDIGQRRCIQPALIAALASRESRGGRLLKRTNGYGDGGNAYGILQCDTRHHNYCLRYRWNSCAHIDMMVKRVLVPYIKAVARKHPSWSKDKQLQGGVAAYNFGVSNVRTWSGLDIGTTGNDYSNDVIARARRLIYTYRWN